MVQDSGEVVGVMTYATPALALEAQAKLSTSLAGARGVRVAVADSEPLSGDQTPERVDGGDPAPAASGAEEGQMTNLYVQHLLPGTTDQSLRHLFAPHGTIVESKVISPRKSGKSNSLIGFVRFATREEAVRAIDNMHQVTLGPGAVPLVVRFAEKPDERADRQARTAANQASRARRPRQSSTSSTPATSPRQASAMPPVSTAAVQPPMYSHSAAAAAAAAAVAAMHAPHAGMPMPPPHAMPSMMYPYPSPMFPASGMDYPPPPPPGPQFYHPMNAGMLPQHMMAAGSPPMSPGAPFPYPLYQSATGMPLPAPAAMMPAQFLAAGAGGRRSGEHTPPIQQAHPAVSPPLPTSSDAGVQQDGNLFVFHLPPDVYESQLARLFAPFGPVESVKVICDRSSGESKGYGFVKFYHIEHASNAVRHMNGFALGGKHLKVSFKTRKSEDRNGTPGRAAPSRGIAAGAAAAAAEQQASSQRATPIRAQSAAWRRRSSSGPPS